MGGVEWEAMGTALPSYTRGQVRKEMMVWCTQYTGILLYRRLAYDLS